MQDIVSRFYINYRRFTVIIPACLTAVIVFISGWLAFNPPASEFTKMIEIVAGGALPILCAGAYEVLSRQGFKWLKFDHNRVRAESGQVQVLRRSLAQVVEPGAVIQPAVADLGGVPWLALDGSNTGQLWLSKTTLDQLEESTIGLLIRYELTRLSLDSLIDRVLVSGCYWWANILALMLLVDKLPLAALWLIPAPAGFAWIINYRDSRLETAADRKVAEFAGPQDYGASLVAFLSSRFGTADHPLIRRRLARLGLSDTEIAGLISHSG